MSLPLPLKEKVAVFCTCNVPLIFAVFATKLELPEMFKVPFTIRLLTVMEPVDAVTLCSFCIVTEKSFSIGSLDAFTQVVPFVELCQVVKLSQPCELVRVR